MDKVRDIFNLVRMGWQHFIYNYSWSDYVVLFDGWVARCAVTVPIVGYLILFNDSISEHLSFNKLAHENLISFGLSSATRLKLIYFGLILLGAANLLYRWRSPFVFKIGRNEADYVENALRRFTAYTYVTIHERIRMGGHKTLHGKYDDAEYESFLDEALGRESGDPKGESIGDWTAAKNKYENLLRSMLIENFFRNDIRKRFSLTACVVLSLLGYSFLLLPSFDLFAKVLVVSLRPLLF